MLRESLVSCVTAQLPLGMSTSRHTNQSLLLSPTTSRCCLFIKPGNYKKCSLFKQLGKLRWSSNILKPENVLFASCCDVSHMESSLICKLEHFKVEQWFINTKVINTSLLSLKTDFLELNVLMTLFSLLHFPYPTHYSLLCLGSILDFFLTLYTTN